MRQRFSRTTRGTGRHFEDAACRQLERAGLRLLERNYGMRGGEIDLVMLDGETLVFVEVRYRRHPAFGSATASVTADKQARIVRTASHYLAHRARHAQRSCRFDVVAFDGAADGTRGSWTRAAFDAF